MRRPPRDPAAPLVTPDFVVWALFQGALVFAFVIAVFAVARSRDLPEREARVLAFAVLVATNVGLVLVNRSTAASVIAAFRQPNPALWWVMGITSSILVAIVLIRPARELFRFGPLHGHDLALALLAGLASLEVVKSSSLQCKAPEVWPSNLRLIRINAEW